MNSGLNINWQQNNENDLHGYYLYLNGVKVNQSPIRNSYFNLTNLLNDESYQISISAVDTAGNESEQSPAFTAIPSSENLPIFKLDTNLSSVVGSVESWFSEIWLLVAFAVSIPLAFLISQRLKSLFIA